MGHCTGVRGTGNSGKMEEEKMSRRQLIFLQNTVPAVAAVAASLVAFWWLAKYSVLELDDIIGTMILVYFGVLAKVALMFEKKLEEKRKAERRKRHVK